MGGEEPGSNVSAAGGGCCAHAPVHHHVQRAPQLVRQSSQCGVYRGEGVARGSGSRTGAAASVVSSALLPRDGDEEVRIEQRLRNRGEEQRVRVDKGAPAGTKWQNRGREAEG